MAPKFNFANIPPAVPSSPKKISSNNIDNNTNKTITQTNNSNNIKSMNYTNMSIAIQSSLINYIQESKHLYNIIPLDICQAVKQRIHNKIITRNRKIKKLNEMSGLDLKLLKEKEMQDHLDRLDLMAGKNTKKLRQSLLVTSQSIKNDPVASNNSNTNSSTYQSMNGLIIDMDSINSLKSSYMSAPSQSITKKYNNHNNDDGNNDLIKHNCNTYTIEDIYNEEEMLKRKADSNEFDFIDYQDCFNNNAFIHNINKQNHSTATTTHNNNMNMNKSNKNTHYIPPPRSTTHLTVQVESHWTLVYIGNENTYACTHLVPPDILLNESKIKVPVQFAIQVLGADHPIYERSTLSRPVTYFTKSPIEILTMSLNNSLKQQQQQQQNKTSTIANNSMIASSSNSNNSPSKNTNNKNNNTNLSKVKREILTAVINDKETVQIEKFLETGICESRGIGESYL